MGSTNSKNLSKDDIAFFKTNTPFTEEQITGMHKIFNEECPNHKLNKQQFIKFYHRIHPAGTGDAVCERLFRFFDTNNSGFIEFKEFLLAVYFSSAGTLEQVLECMFHTYDINRDGSISEAELTKIVQAIHEMHPGEAKDAAKVRAKTMFAKADINKDKKLSKQEFIRYCLADPDIFQTLSSRPITVRRI